jgi:hypothetical protein
MTDKQSEALRLADLLENEKHVTDFALSKAAAELRRLHEVNAELVEALREMVEWYAARDLDNQICPALNQNPEIYEAMQVLAKATGEQQ